MTAIVRKRFIISGALLIGITIWQFYLTTVPAFALDCTKKPCHKNCISSQPNYVQTQCRCNARKKVYYHYWGTNYGVPEYDMACDGTFEQYTVKYCAEKRRYDNWQLNNDNPNIANKYTPQYDPICDGSQAEYTRNIQILKQTQAINNMADSLRNQNINVHHSGTVNQNVNVNGNYFIQGTHNIYHY
ncbi:MAG: hypothetical protein NC191_02770 [Muribaculaceae bacterium]|nr:hypothetical protein [Muribaculaceae bacterium]